MEGNLATTTYLPRLHEFGQIFELIKTYTDSPFVYMAAVDGSLYLSGKLPTHLSPKPAFTLASHLGQNVGLGEGEVGIFPSSVQKFV